MSWSKLPPEERERRSAAWAARAARFDAPPLGGDFYDTGRWQLLRNKTIARYGNRCLRCSAEWSAENPIQVDHIKPRSKYPELECDLSNLQVLCKACNHAKGNWDETDWRPR